MSPLKTTTLKCHIEKRNLPHNVCENCREIRGAKPAVLPLFKLYIKLPHRQDSPVVGCMYVYVELSPKFTQGMRLNIDMATGRIAGGFKHPRPRIHAPTPAPVLKLYRR